MAQEQFKNDLGSGTLLSTALTDTVGTSVNVSSTSGMPTTPQFRIRIDTEIMLVTNVVSTTLTVVRGAEGSTAATHLVNAPVYHVLTAASVQIPGLQWGAFPASSTGYLVPTLANFSWINQGSATATTIYDADGVTPRSITLYDPATSGDNLRCLDISTPSTPYTLTVYIQNNCTLNVFFPVGLYWGDGTKLVTAMIRPNTSDNTVQFYADKWTNVTTFSANYTAVKLTSPDFWQQITDDGSNRICRVSKDGLNWVQVHSVGRTDFLTPTHTGIVFEANNTTYPFYASWLHYQQT